MVKDSSITNCVKTCNFKVKRGQWVMDNGQWTMYTIHCKMGNDLRVPVGLRSMSGIEE
jgi:hypothetical protein